MSRLLGAHMSISGGVSKSIARGEAVDCRAIQIFTKNNTRWQASDLQSEEIKRFKDKLKESKIAAVFAHNSYLVNLASLDQQLFDKSVKAMVVELERCQQLSIPFLVMHPGSHGGAGEAKGIARISKGIKQILKQTKGNKTKLALETTAGQGKSIGYRFEHLAEILNQVDNPQRMGVCFDTCHVFAAGYQLNNKKDYQQTISSFEKIIGLNHLLGFHLNDSKKPLASRVDRHEHIGQGHLGLKPFEFLLNDSRFESLPMCLETPKGKDGKEDRENLARLYSLIK